MKTVNYIDSALLKDNMSEIMINSSLQHNNIVRFYYYDIEEIKNQNKKVNSKYNLYSYIELMEGNLFEEMEERQKNGSNFSKDEVIDIIK